MQGPDAPFTPTAEVDRLAWLPLADARQRLDYQRDAYAIDALEVLAAGPSVLLVRNGRAVPVRQRADSEGDRSLDSKGQEQAEALRLALPAFEPSRLLSVPDARFTGTMRPLGADLGLTIETEPALGEEEYATHPCRGLTRILELAGASGTTAVCAPGAVIRHLLADLADDAGLDLEECPAKRAVSGRCSLLAGSSLRRTTTRISAARYPDGSGHPDQPVRTPDGRRR